LAPLIGALEDPVRRVRAAAAEAIEKLAQCTVSPLIQALGSQDTRVRSRSVKALGNLIQAILPPLQGLSDNQDDEKTTRMASEILENLSQQAPAHLSQS